jgi:hypothetical protein
MTFHTLLYRIISLNQSETSIFPSDFNSPGIDQSQLSVFSSDFFFLNLKIDLYEAS